MPPSTGTEHEELDTLLEPLTDAAYTPPGYRVLSLQKSSSVRRAFGVYVGDIEAGKTAPFRMVFDLPCAITSFAVKCLEGVHALSDVSIAEYKLSTGGLLFGDDLALILPYLPQLETDEEIRGYVLALSDCKAVFIHGTIELFDELDDDDGDGDEFAPDKPGEQDDPE